MLIENKTSHLTKSKFAENWMILYMTVNLVKLLENNVGYEDDEMTKEILNITLNELFKSVLKLDNGIWN
tara:strand:- start:1298 stop:1504 length:207 start_codon:yes stop_codon:yes gene_type:complete